MGSFTRLVDKLGLGLSAPQMKFAQVEMCVSVSVPAAKGGVLTDRVVTVADTMAVRVRRSAV